MKSTITKSILLAVALTLSLGTKAQTYGVTDEASNQNTPDGWTAVALPQLPEITSANTITLTADDLSATDDNTDAIQAALDKVPSAGGMVVLPAGTWLFGNGTKKQLIINSKTILHLAAGCTLKLQPYGTAANDKTPFIICKNSSSTSDIVIEGENKETSVIDGDGWDWWAARENSKTFNPGSMIRFVNGKRYLVKNLTFKNTPGTNVTLGQSGKGSDFTVHDIIISEPASELGNGKSSHNTDGIPIWGPRVNIYDCTISNGDDNVVVDSNGQYVHVWNCYFGTGHGASVGSYTSNVKHVWFDNITMNGTTAGVRLKTGINSDGTLRGGGEEDFKFTNFTMTGVKNPFSMDCFYDKNYSADPATDEANARTLDSTTPTYNGILLQNIKTTDVCSGRAIFLVGRPESHIKNVTLDNVQIQAKTGIDLRWVDNLVFKNGSKITCTSGKLWIKQYKATVDDQCNAAPGSDESQKPDTGEGTSVSYTIDATTTTAASGDASPWTFTGGITVSNEGGKTYSTGKLNTIKYTKGLQYTITLPENVTITSASFTGYGNADNTACYLSELNGTSYDESAYSFPGRPTSGTPETATHEVTLDSPATGTMTFTAAGAQACFAITLKGIMSTAINSVNADVQASDGALYNLAGQRVSKSYKGVVIQNGKKYILR